MTDKRTEDLERVLGAYTGLKQRFEKAGGLREVLGLYEGLRGELAKVSQAELEGLTAEIKDLVEALLAIDYEIRKVQNLKLLFDEQSDDAGDGNGAVKTGR